MGYAIIAFAIIVVVSAVVLSIYQTNELMRRRYAAKLAYQDGLARLKNDPNNSELRQKVLRLGREYSNLTRNKRGVTVFDEVALKNDIDAACAGAVSVRGATPVEERLAKLKRLHAAGHISEEEYNRRRQAIINEV